MKQSIVNDSSEGGLTLISNLTPHVIKIVLDGGKVIEIPASGEIARVAAASESVGSAAGIPLFATTYGTVAGLPDSITGTFYIVSALVRSALPDRKDLLSPSQLLRDNTGAVVGAQGFDVNL